MKNIAESFINVIYFTKVFLFLYPVSFKMKKKRRRKMKIIEKWSIEMEESPLASRFSSIKSIKAIYVKAKFSKFITFSMKWHTV